MKGTNEINMMLTTAMTGYETQLARGLGVRLITWRASKRLTRAELARMSGVPECAIVRAEEGGNVTLQMLIRFAALMNMTVNVLLLSVRYDINARSSEEKYIRDLTLCVQGPAVKGSPKRRERPERRAKQTQERTKQTRTRAEYNRAKREERLIQKAKRARHEAAQAMAQAVEQKRIMRRRHRELNSIAETEPWMCDWWDTKANGKLTPLDVGKSSMKTVHWKCPKGPDHRFKAQVLCFFLAKNKCPFCSGRRACMSNCLSTLYPDLAIEFDWLDNGCRADEVVASVVKTQERYWWTCKQCGWHWQETLKGRIEAAACPHCSHLAATA